MRICSKLKDIHTNVCGAVEICTGADDCTMSRCLHAFYRRQQAPHRSPICAVLGLPISGKGKETLFFSMFGMITPAVARRTIYRHQIDFVPDKKKLTMR